MSTSATGGPGRSPLRIAGVTLVGLALVLAVVGVLTGTSNDTTAAASSASTSASTSVSPSPTTATTTTAPSGRTTTPPATDAPTTTNAPTTTTAAPTTLAPTTVPPAAVAPDPRTSVDVVVLNNSTVGGLALRAAEDVRGRGWTVVEVGNYTGLVPTTTAYYRPGTAEEAAARALAADTGARVEPRFDGLPSAAAGVVLVVTADYAG
jgi:cytoskeletal protein RodZ